MFGNKFKVLLGQKNGHVLKKVIHHHWVNFTTPSNPYQFLEWLELHFNNEPPLVIQKGMESECLEVVDFNLENEKQLIQSQFGGKIMIASQDLSSHEMWLGITGHVVEIEFSPELEEIPYPDSFLIKTIKGAILLSPSEEEGITLEKFIDD